MFQEVIGSLQRVNSLITPLQISDTPVLRRASPSEILPAPRGADALTRRPRRGLLWRPCLEIPNAPSESSFMRRLSEHSFSFTVRFMFIKAEQELLIKVVYRKI